MAAHDLRLQKSNSVPNRISTSVRLLVNEAVTVRAVKDTEKIYNIRRHEIRLMRLILVNDHMHVQFREATEADVERLCEINRAAIERLGTESYSERQVSAWKTGIEPALYPIDDPETHFLVAETTEYIIGFGWMKPEADEYFTINVGGEITGMYVYPSAAGMGIGTRLLDKLEWFAQETSVDSLGLWASLNAVPFYNKQGYKTVTEQALEYDDGTELPVKEMKKRLD